ncbi:hypothetical protein [Solimicrobium silvestre]|uniref:Uncharacterized protein n=1 Tax=Solimicrobium silvestre TaxID=2099400 RepID=A0A2S9GSV6_9BURK|nr:hypothetical protein [Solimicrobium silvestre]PRC90793.1 hypothetical protein S2091_4541 [Solimicrobium silvestre]
MQKIPYIAAAVIGLLLSAYSLIFAMLSGPQFAWIIGCSLLLAHILAAIIAIKKATNNKMVFAIVTLISPVFIVFIGAMLFLYAESLENRYLPDKNFVKICEDSELKYFRSPKLKVSSIHLDWAPMSGSIMSKYIIDSDHMFEDVEDNLIVPDMISDSTLSDVLVTHEISNPDELNQAIVNRGLIQYTLTVTDRRDGSKLATMKYAVDHSKKRACGNNTSNAIDLNAFITNATALSDVGNSVLISSKMQQNSTLDKEKNISDNPISVDFEVLETEKYSRRRVVTNGEIDLFFKEQEQICDSLLKPYRLGTPWMTFKKDPSGLKKIDFYTGFKFCGSNAVWMGDYVYKGDSKHFVLTKYADNGDFNYRIRILRPNNPIFDTASLDETTFHAADGVITFDWINFDRDSGVIRISQRMKIQIKEPIKRD